MRRFLPLIVVTGTGIALGTGQSRVWDALQAYDKPVHAAGFMLFALALRYARPRWTLLRVGAAALAATIALELVQAVIPGRTASALDVLAGLAGVIAALAVLRLGRPRFQEADLPQE